MSLPQERVEPAPTVSITPLPDQSDDSFLVNVSTACRLLRSMHLRCSLFVIHPAGMSARSAAARLTSRLGVYGLVGILPNGRVGFLHLDRCLVAEKGDEAVTAFVRGQAAETLGAGWTRRLAAFHYWTDEVPEIGDLLPQLDGVAAEVDTARPRASLVGCR